MVFTDGELIDALIAHGSIRQAAKALGVSPQAITDRLRKAETRQALDETKDLLISSAALSMSDCIGDSVAALMEIVRGENYQPQQKISAADSVLRHCTRYVEASSIIRRIEALEATRIESEGM